MQLSKKTVIEWDVSTWARALPFWSRQLDQASLPNPVGLELGGRNGGISLYFAKKHQAEMICSDLAPPAQNALDLHLQHGVSHLIRYQQINATKLPYENNSFDFVVFKSMLGVIGANNEVQNIHKSLREIHRVLKPNGMLFFAENLSGSWLHRFARRQFVTWGKKWRYISLPEMEDFLSLFSEKEMHTTGFFAAFVPKPAWLKSLVAHIDPLFFFLPKNWRYVGYGYAVK